jgi:hypothetical protein
MGDGGTHLHRQHLGPVRHRCSGVLPEVGIANSRAQIGRLFAEVGGTLKSITRDYFHV